MLVLEAQSKRDKGVAELSSKYGFLPPNKRNEKLQAIERSYQLALSRAQYEYDRVYKDTTGVNVLKTQQVVTNPNNPNYDASRDPNEQRRVAQMNADLRANQQRMASQSSRTTPIPARSADVFTPSLAGPNPTPQRSAVVRPVQAPIFSQYYGGQTNPMPPSYQKPKNVFESPKIPVTEKPIFRQYYEGRISIPKPVYIKTYKTGWFGQELAKRRNTPSKAEAATRYLSDKTTESSVMIKQKMTKYEPFSPQYQGLNTVMRSQQIGAEVLGTASETFKNFRTNPGKETVVFGTTAIMGAGFSAAEKAAGPFVKPILRKGGMLVATAYGAQVGYKAYTAPTPQARQNIWSQTGVELAGFGFGAKAGSQGFQATTRAMRTGTWKSDQQYTLDYGFQQPKGSTGNVDIKTTYLGPTQKKLSDPIVTVQPVNFAGYKKLLADARMKNQNFEYLKVASMQSGTPTAYKAGPSAKEFLKQEFKGTSQEVFGPNNQKSYQIRKPLTGKKAKQELQLVFGEKGERSFQTKTRVTEEPRSGLRPEESVLKDRARPEEPLFEQKKVVAETNIGQESRSRSLAGIRLGEGRGLVGTGMLPATRRIIDTSLKSKSSSDSLLRVTGTGGPGSGTPRGGSDFIGIGASGLVIGKGFLDTRIRNPDITQESTYKWPKPFALGGGGRLGRGFPKWKGVGRQPRKYQPSLTAVALGIRGKIPRGPTSGLTIRPLPLKRKTVSLKTTKSLLKKRKWRY
jgi:hypothetical protein